MSTRTLSFLLGALAVGLAGCRGSTPRASRADDPPTITSAQGGEPFSLKARMRDHDAHGAAMRDAVARADLAAARREAKVLAELRVGGGIEAPWRRSLDAMNAAAARVAEAKDLGEASRGVAMVARTCGDCHATLGGPAAAVGEPPHESPEVVPRMQRHLWAATRLWDGLVVPSEDAWHTGAHVLGDAPLEPERMTPGKSPAAEVGTLARAVRELARRAAAAESKDERSVTYGEILATCSACHKWLGGGPPASKR